MASSKGHSGRSGMPRVRAFRCKHEDSKLETVRTFSSQSPLLLAGFLQQDCTAKAFPNSPTSGDQLFKWQRQGGHSYSHGLAGLRLLAVPQLPKLLGTQTHERLGNVPSSSHCTFCPPVWPPTCCAVPTSKEGLSD